ncbi:flavin-dependent dehydrogenase [Methanohalophilus levihalophilus]|uniref:NAD(P)/FAD-dependent oxidoreductase n=1 Tax=Methanohalophilus levihalophilus TaxID=1431282 RepID=UPI001FD9C8DC|nr:FAD-dependent oxidoreductase [Methanohalophilus levihalophilus]MBP2030815.1 flavin-dependent dehydrogenase [Methanohalophilus levihalophilus]
MYDVIVVGAGPAGATAARKTAKAGLKTLLLEKSRLPRVKVCGGGVSMQTVSNLGICIPESLIERKCFGARVRYKNMCLESEANECLALMVSREKFDSYLTMCAVE